MQESQPFSVLSDLLEQVGQILKSIFILFVCSFCDVSAISEEVAKFSNWFDATSCKTGIDGAKLMKEIFENVEKYIKKPGHFYFPIISLSNVDYIKEYSFSKFNKIKKIKRFNWPLPEEMMINFETLKSLKEKKCVDYKEVFGMIICYTDVYEVSFE